MAVGRRPLSRGTRRIDEGEKKDAYLTIGSLGVYVLIEQETPAAIVFRRTDHGFVREVYQGLDAIIPLPVFVAYRLGETYLVSFTAYVVYSPTPSAIFDESTGKVEWVYPLEKKVDRDVKLVATY